MGKPERAKQGWNLAAGNPPPEGCEGEELPRNQGLWAGKRPTLLSEGVGGEGWGIIVMETKEELSSPGSFPSDERERGGPPTRPVSTGRVGGRPKRQHRAVA